YRPPTTLWHCACPWQRSALRQPPAPMPHQPSGPGSPASEFAVGRDSGATLAPPSIDPSQFVVTRIRALRGPNYWRLAPVIAADVRLGSLEPLTSADIPGFTERLLMALPSLADHPCSRGAPGGFVARLYDGTHLPHILEHVA